MNKTYVRLSSLSINFHTQKFIRKQTLEISPAIK